MPKIKSYILAKKELFGMKGLDSFLKKPNVTAFDEIDKDVLSLIKKNHKKYVTEISSPEMAISLELAVFLYKLAIHLKPKITLDLGAGFSSFVLRLAAQNSTSFKVYSVDDDKNWLQKTIDYLTTNRLSTENTISISDFNKLSDVTFDLILLDLNFVDVRKNYIEKVITSANKNACIIFDDTHKIEYLRAVKEHALKNKINLFNLRNSTLDSFGRFAIMGVK